MLVKILDILHNACKLFCMALSLVLSALLISVSVGSSVLAYEVENTEVEVETRIVYVRESIEETETKEIQKLTENESTTVVEKSVKKKKKRKKNNKKVTTEPSAEVETSTEPVTEPEQTTEAVTEKVETETTVKEVETEPYVQEVKKETDPLKEVASYNSIYYSVTIDKMINEINAKRKKEGLPLYTKDDTLCQIACYRAEEMRMNDGIVSHTRPNGQDAFSMQDIYNYHVGWYGECLGKYYESASAMVQGWEDSTEHNKIIKHTTLTKVGCGIAVEDDGDIIFVAVFSN